jgi:hypothetical protein
MRSRVRIRRSPAATSRQPSMASPRKPRATTTNAKAVPWPETTRSNIPIATVEMHTTAAPASETRSLRVTATTVHPTARPDRNGQAVDAMPATLKPWSWTERPIATKTSTQIRSSDTPESVASFGRGAREGWTTEGLLGGGCGDKSGKKPLDHRDRLIAGDLAIVCIGDIEARLTESAHQHERQRPEW